MTKQRTTVTTTEAEIRALVDQHLTIVEVAKRLNVDVRRLRNVCCLLGIRSKRVLKTDGEKLHGWVERIANGDTVSDVAAEVGVTRQWVYSILKRAGLPTTTRAAIRAKRAAEFPGVDIDAAHKRQPVSTQGTAA